MALLHREVSPRKGSCCLREREAGRVLGGRADSRYLRKEARNGSPSLVIPAALCPASRDPWCLRTLRQKEKLSKLVSAGVGPRGTLLSHSVALRVAWSMHVAKITWFVPQCRLFPLWPALCQSHISPGSQRALLFLAIACIYPKMYSWSFLGQGCSPSDTYMAVPRLASGLSLTLTFGSLVYVRGARVVTLFTAARQHPSAPGWT